MSLGVIFPFENSSKCEIVKEVLVTLALSMKSIRSRSEK